MASSKQYLDYVLEQCDNVTARTMMGEFVLYYDGKVVGGIYDNRLLVKPTPSALTLIPYAPKEIPYVGAKEMLLVEEVENGELLDSLFCGIAKDLIAVKK